MAKIDFFREINLVEVCQELPRHFRDLFDIFFDISVVNVEKYVEKKMLKHYFKTKAKLILPPKFLKKSVVGRFVAQLVTFKTTGLSSRGEVLAGHVLVVHGSVG